MWFRPHKGERIPIRKDGQGRGERLIIMKYIKPALKIEEAQVVSMLAESLPIGDTKVDGGQALTKEADWDLWSDDEE